MKYRVITGKLVARTAVHVGSGEGNELADSLLRRDAQGDIVIPGTAIAGALRAFLTRLAPRLGGGTCVALLPDAVRDERARQGQKGCTCRVCRLFGDVEPSDEVPAEGEESRSAASRLLVFNAHLTEGSAAPTLIRDGVGIDRATGAAARAAGAKFAMEVLPAGAEFALRMELREDASDDQMKDEQLLTVALAEWQAGRLHLGGDVARGLGAFRLKDLHYGERDLDDADELMAFLRDPNPWEHVQEQAGWLQDRLNGAMDHIWTLEKAQGDATQRWGLDAQEVARLPIARGWAEWEFTLQAEGPLLTNDATASGLSGFDHAPLLATLGDWTKPVLTGAGLRGVLRSHAERIARTLATHRATGQPDPQAYFLTHCPACDPLARRSRSEDTTTALESCDSLLRYQARVDENEEIAPEQLCLACRLFGSTRRGSRLIVEDAPFAGDGPPVYKMLDFLAIDRFTGGGAEHLKFDALALWKPTFKVRLFLEDPEEWELGWLTLVLRDLAEGWLRVGFGAAKGFGQVKIADGTLRLATLDASRSRGGQGSIYVIDERPLTDWTQAAGWVEAFNGEVERFERDAEMSLPADSYFGVVDDIYGGGDGR